MKNNAYVITRDRRNVEFFTASSAFDRARWVKLNEATEYHSPENAQAAVKKLWLSGNFQAKVIPLSEMELQIELPQPASQSEECETCHCNPCQCEPSCSCVDKQHHEEDCEWSVVPKSKIPGVEDEEYVMWKGTKHRVVVPNARGPMIGIDVGGHTKLVHQNELSAVEDEECATEEDGERAYSHSRFLPGTPVKVEGESGFEVVQDDGTGIVAVRPAGSTAVPSKIDARDVIKEATIPVRKGDEPAQPTENNSLIPNLKEPKVAEINLNDPVGTEHKPETDIDYATDYPHEEKVKVPGEVMSALRATLVDFQKCADLSNARDDAKASFCLTVVECLKELEDLLQIGTVVAIKQAQIKLTSWMNPITTNIPDVVKMFIYRGGRQPSLRDMFDIKKGEKLAKDAATGFGDVK